MRVVGGRSRDYTEGTPKYVRPERRAGNQRKMHPEIVAQFMRLARELRDKQERELHP